MIGDYLSLALRNVARTKLYAAISVTGLAIGFAALRGFAKRVELDWWLFVGAACVTLGVAVAAVLVHTWGMAGTRPVAALRYE